MELYIGLMSGTSADGIDAALVDFTQNKPAIIATHFAPYSASLKEKIHALTSPGDDEIHRLGELDHQLGLAFAEAANMLIAQHNVTADAIKAIGSHGQTVRHFPHEPYRFTLQIADPNIIAAKTGITTVADFRRKDIAHGGQGAPLVPAFHQSILHDQQQDRVIVNIGGIANVSILWKQQPEQILGFDTGPGNVLMDSWIMQQQQKTHDEQGEWAASGKVNNALLELCLQDLYFNLPPPKSTGREHFNAAWLEKRLRELNHNVSPADVQATLAELTAKSIVEATLPHLDAGEMLVCGGGARNTHLMSRLSDIAAPHFRVKTTHEYGIDPDWMEAIAFAWLAKQTLERKPGNVPSVTGAKKAAVLGGVYYC